jgi:hypothetical protein
LQRIFFGIAADFNRPCRGSRVKAVAISETDPYSPI